MPNRLNLGRIRHFLTFSSLLGLSDPPIETVSRSPLPLSALRYIAVVAAVILAVVPIAVSGWHGVPSSLLLFLLAVLLCALFAGRRAALVAALVGGIINLLLALASLSAWATTTLVVDIQAAIFVVIALSIIALSEHRRHAQERLQYYTGLTGAITCDPDEAVCAADEFGRVTFANVAVGHILDSPVSELHGKGLHLILHQAAGTRCSGTADSCSFLRMLQPGTTVRTGEEEIFVRQGEQRHISYVSAPIMRGGRAQGVALRFRDVTDRARTVQSLRESEERYRTLVETAPDGIILVDLYGFVMMVNGRASRMYGYASPDAMVGVRSMELFEAHDRLRFTETTRRVASRESVSSEEYAALRVDGHSFPIEMRAALLAEEDGDPRAVIYVCRDITEQKRMDQSLHVTEVCAAVQQAASAALAQSLTFGEASLNLVMSICRSAGWDTGMLWMLDDGETVLKCQTVWCRPEVDLAGFEEVSRDLTVAVGHDLPGRVWEIGSPIWIVDVVTDQNFPRALLASKAGLHTAVCLPVQTGGVTRGVLEFFVREPQPENRELVATIVSVCGQFGQFIERKQAEHALQHQARHDALTGLPNRLLLQERVRRALNTASGQDTTAALLLIDLDRFKDVNDTLGHHYGDLLLQHVSQRLSGVLRESDTVARLGGDEFAVLLPASDVVGASLVADKILQVLEQPQYVNGRQIDVGASIGIAVYPLHAEDEQTLMQRADVAMYVAKRSKIGYTVYRSEEDNHSPDRLALMAWLRQAIEQQRLLVHYQPKVNLRTGVIESVEALARWHHPDHGDIPPEQFIPLAEQSGLIRPLSYCILNESLRQCRRWREAGLPLGVAVNLSPENLHDPQLVIVIAGTLRTHQLPADSLTIEITESAIMADSSRAMDTLTQLNRMGVRIAIDDFGTGYSSLAYLKRLPVDEIKIDKSFVMDMADHDDDAFIARSVIDLGHNLGLEVVAEGVKSETVWGILNSMGCDHAQGFYLSEPLPASELVAWLIQAGAISADSVAPEETGSAPFFESTGA